MMWRIWSHCGCLKVMGLCLICHHFNSSKKCPVSHLFSINILMKNIIQIQYEYWNRSTHSTLFEQWRGTNELPKGFMTISTFELRDKEKPKTIMLDIGKSWNTGLRAQVCPKLVDQINRKAQILTVCQKYIVYYIAEGESWVGSKLIHIYIFSPHKLVVSNIQ